MSTQIRIPINEISADTSMLDFAANRYYMEDCRQNGRTPMWWLTLSPEVRQEFLLATLSTYQGWIGEERKAQILRNTR